ncbi:hypothetical protein PAMP_016102 [Pampus punctatissimus]
MKLQPGMNRSLAGCCGLVLVLCHLRQQNRSLLAAGEEDRSPASRLTVGPANPD